MQTCTPLDAQGQGRPRRVSEGDSRSPGRAARVKKRSPAGERFALKNRHRHGGQQNRQNQRCHMQRSAAVAGLVVQAAVGVTGVGGKQRIHRAMFGMTAARLEMNRFGRPYTRAMQRTVHQAQRLREQKRQRQQPDDGVG